MSFTMKLFVSPRAAIRDGRTEFGPKEVTVEATDLEHVSVAVCEELVLAYEGGDVVGKGFLTANLERFSDLEASTATTQELFRLLDYRAHIRAIATKDQAEREERQRGEEARAQEAAAVEKRERDAKKARQLLAIQKWVNKHGTESQKKRLVEGVLPDSEVIENIAELAFEALSVNDVAELYQKIRDEDVCACACADRVVFNVDDADALTEAQYDTLVETRVEVKDLIGQTGVRALRHHGKCPACDCPEVVRLSLRVQMAWEGLDLVREYNL